MSDIKVWVDADACPKPIKEILFKAATKKKFFLILVANRYLATPGSPFIKVLTVPSGFDEADNEIVKQLNPGDLVITADIPLAAQVIEKNGFVLTPSGQEYTQQDINYRLSIRNFMESLRSSGVETKGPNKFSQSDRKAFADSFGNILNRMSQN